MRIKKIGIAFLVCVLGISASSISVFAEDITDSWEVIECGDNQIATTRTQLGG